MSSIADRNLYGKRQFRPAFRNFRRRARAWQLIPALLAVVVVVVVSAVTYVRATGSAPVSGATTSATHAQAADLFIRSIVTDDGALGWHQLCPSVQRQVPQDALIQQATAQRDAAAQQGLKLTSDFIGARPRPSGGEVRLYMLTAHWPNGTMEQRTYSVLTQTSGCVEDVKNQ